MVSPKFYYIQDARKFVGDSFVWWSKDAHGYCLDLEDAGVFPEEEAKRICANRDTDVMWPREYVDAHARHHINTERSHMSIEEAKAWDQMADGEVHILPSRVSEIIRTPLADHAGLFPPYSFNPVISVGELKRIAKGFEAARALLDGDDTLESAGVHPGPERMELEAALKP